LAKEIRSRIGITKGVYDKNINFIARYKGVTETGILSE
jgi:hypothetical protein